MKNMDKGLTVPKWVLIVWPKIPKMLQNLFAQFVCPKVWDSNEKRLHRASVVHAQWLVGYKRSNEGCVKHLIIKQTPSFNKVTCSVLSILVRGWQKRTPYSQCRAGGTLLIFFLHSLLISVQEPLQGIIAKINKSEFLDHFSYRGLF